MHYRTNLSPKYEGKSGLRRLRRRHDGDGRHVGELLKLLDELGIADNTMVMFSTDNGAATNSWPDGGNQPFRGEKGVGGYEGGFRVPMVVQVAGRDPAGHVHRRVHDAWRTGFRRSWRCSASPT